MSHRNVQKTASPSSVAKSGRFAGLSEARWWSLENVVRSVEALDNMKADADKSRLTPTQNGTGKVPSNVSAECPCERHPEGADKPSAPTPKAPQRGRVSFVRTRNEKSSSVKKVITKEFVPKSILKKTTDSPGKFTNKSEIIAYRDRRRVEESKALQSYAGKNGSENEIEEYSSGLHDNMSDTYIQHSFLSRLGETESNYTPEEPFHTTEPITICPVAVQSLPPGVVSLEADVDNLKLQFRHYKPVKAPPVYPFNYPVASYNVYEDLLQSRSNSTSIFT